MRHHYSTVDGIVTTFSDIYSSPTRGESIVVHMERVAAKGFDIAEFALPSFTCQKYNGFSEGELLGYKDLNRLLKGIAANKESIVFAWYRHFGLK